MIRIEMMTMCYTFPLCRIEIVDTKIITRVFECGRAEDHILHELHLLEFIFELLTRSDATAPRIEDQPPSANFALAEEQQSNSRRPPPIRTFFLNKISLNIFSINHCPLTM